MITQFLFDRDERFIANIIQQKLNDIVINVFLRTLKIILNNENAFKYRELYFREYINKKQIKRDKILSIELDKSKTIDYKKSNSITIFISKYTI